jgi:hypothetical protein
MRARGTFLVVGLATCAVVAACSSADPFGTPPELEKLLTEKKSCRAGGAKDGGPRKGDFEPIDPSTLPSCCDDGAAHCVDASKVPAQYKESFSACPTGICVPDAILKSGGAALPTCPSFNGPGVCLSICNPFVKKYKSAMKRESCAADEYCAPCTNPQDGSRIPTCDFGGGGGEETACETEDGGTPPAGDPKKKNCPYAGPPASQHEGNVLGSIAGGAHCISKDIVGEEATKYLSDCPTGACAPDEFIRTAGNVSLKTCTTKLGAEGRCMHEVLPQVQSFMQFLSRDGCASYERCVPCFNPVDGAEIPICRIGCDAGPTKPKVVFSSCCKGTGKCVPAEMTPPEGRDYLRAESCATGLSCVPTEMMPPKLARCTGSLPLYGKFEGRCMSKCLELGFQGEIAPQGTCDADHVCAPCTMFGRATGVPDCAP